MRFIIHPEIWEQFPGMQVAVVVAHDLNNQIKRPQVKALWEETWTAAAKAATYGNAQSHPQIHQWRECFRAIGVSSKKFPSSIEALLRRALKGGQPFYINPLVDYYNTVSLRHIVPVGGFDLDVLQGSLEARLTHDGDQFTGLDTEDAVIVSPNEIAYADQQTLLTRHFMWRQARTGLITESTRSAVFVSEILDDVDSDLVLQVLGDLKFGLREYFGVIPSTFVVNENSPAIEF
jgi:DNA/RNA-binding domain of Phe-tRNA-synthetase-like protein